MEKQFLDSKSLNLKGDGPTAHKLIWNLHGGENMNGGRNNKTLILICENESIQINPTSIVRP